MESLAAILAAIQAALGDIEWMERRVWPLDVAPRALAERSESREKIQCTARSRRWLMTVQSS